MTVLDNATPTVASCPSDATIECPATPVFGTPTFSDACDSNLTVTFADEVLTISGNQVSKTKRTWTATDAHNNSTTCSQIITVIDSTTPVVASCPADATIECPATPAFGTPTFSDACDSNLTVTFADEVLTISGNQVSKTKRTWTATDAHNNSTTCSQIITVIDSTTPVVASCPADATIECPATPAFGTPTFSDACDSNLTVTLADEVLTISGQELSKTKRTWTATDDHNNSTTCSQTITVTDTTAPVVTCPADSSASADANCQAPVPNILSGLTVSDTCSAAGAITLSQAPEAGTPVGLGTNTITVTATDAAGNSSTCTTTFTVTGNATLTVTCPASSSASADANCQAAVPDVLSGVTVDGGCSSGGTNTLSQSPEAGTLVGVGVHTITVTATDAAGNNASCTTTFTVIDTTPPTVTCPAASTANAGANCQAAVPNVLSGVTVSDNCTSAASITLSQSPTAGTMVGLGPHTITVTATDAAGNSASCTTSFTVIDNTAPTVTCPAATSASAGANCQAAVPNVLSGVIVSDNCSSTSAITLTQTPAAGTLVGQGTYTITVTATDAAGNSASCTTSFTVTGVQGAAIKIVTLT